MTSPTGQPIAANTDTVRATGNQLLTLHADVEKLMTRMEAVAQQVTVDGTVDGRIMPAAQATSDAIRGAIQQIKTKFGPISTNLKTAALALTGESDRLEQNDQAGADAANGITTPTTPGGTGGTGPGSTGGSGTTVAPPTGGAEGNPPQTGDEGDPPAAGTGETPTSATPDTSTGADTPGGINSSGPGSSSGPGTSVAPPAGGAEGNPPILGGSSTDNPDRPNSWLPPNERDSANPAPQTPATPNPAPTPAPNPAPTPAPTDTGAVTT